ncbi:MAG: hypothetical protein H6607_02285 [Flavobacteriales bacterium]|nr:hypothetical protein [Flavobacteriales bacterium]
MKRFYFYLLAMAIGLGSFAQSETKPEKVYSLVKQRRTTEWYRIQAELWKKEIDKNQQNVDAWHNYYRAKRMLKIYKEGVTQKDLDSIVSTMSTAIPNTFEYHYISFYNSGFRNPEIDVTHLRKAQELGPDRVEIMADLMTYYEVKRNHKQLETIAQKWFASNDISTGIYSFCYNMLMSVDDNAILITYGDNDTYPCWILQYVKGIKPNVSIINASLIMQDEYRHLLFKEMGLPDLKFDTTKSDWFNTAEEKLLRHIKSNTNRPVYLAVSVHKNRYEFIKDEVYNVGLAYKWSDEKFDNIAVIKKNYEKYFLKDYITHQFQNDISQAVVDDMNSNYLVPLVTLYHHYKESEDPEQLALKSVILTIAGQVNQLEEIKKLL